MNHDIKDKLQRGFELIGRSHGDADLLGVALLAMHGALEDHLREALEACADLSAEERQLLSRRDAGWLPLVELAQKRLGLRQEERQLILEANKARQAFAHGEQFAGRVSNVLRYARFVERLCGQPGLLDHTLIEQTHVQPASTRAAPHPTGRAQPPTHQRPRPADRGAPKPPIWASSGISINRLIFLALVVIVLTLSVWAFRSIDGTRLLMAIGALPAPTATPRATPPIATSTPPTSQARIVGLGDGIGWLHNTPSFNSGTLPIPLRDGATVEILDREPIEAEGARWRYVATGGYEGWCPENNLAIEAAP